jgi:hypothetical protein
MGKQKHNWDGRPFTVFDQRIAAKTVETEQFQSLREINEDFYRQMGEAINN